MDHSAYWVLFLFLLVNLKYILMSILSFSYLSKSLTAVFLHYGRCSSIALILSYYVFCSSAFNNTQFLTVTRIMFQWHNHNNNRFFCIQIVEDLVKRNFILIWSRLKWLCMDTFSLGNQMEGQSQKLYLEIFQTVSTPAVDQSFCCRCQTNSSIGSLQIRIQLQVAFNKLLRKSYSKANPLTLQMKSNRKGLHPKVTFISFITIGVSTALWEFLCYALNVAQDKTCLGLKW